MKIDIRDKYSTSSDKFRALFYILVSALVWYYVLYMCDFINVVKLTYEYDTEVGSHFSVLSGSVLFACILCTIYLIYMTCIRLKPVNDKSLKDHSLYKALHYLAESGVRTLWYSERGMVVFGITKDTGREFRPKIELTDSVINITLCISNDRAYLLVPETMLFPDTVGE